MAMSAFDKPVPVASTAQVADRNDFPPLNDYIGDLRQWRTNFMRPVSQGYGPILAEKGPQPKPTGLLVPHFDPDLMEYEILLAGGLFGHELNLNRVHATVEHCRD